MVRYIAICFGFMGLGFYELSGGSDFEPAQWRDVKAPEINVAELPEADTPPVSETVVVSKIVKSEAPAQTKANRDPLVVLASVPTTRRLVGNAAPTPSVEITKLGPADAPSNVIANKEDVFSNAIALERAPDFRRVSGNRVNMRNGPGTQYSVVDQLVRDNEVEILQDPGQGWVKLQVVETGRIGWMSAKLLRKIDS